MSEEKKSKSINLHTIFLGLQDQMIASLSTNREVIKHASTKGEATELHWLDMLNNYLPKRYRTDKAFVLDCEGHLSDQIDVVIYDRQYSPFLFNQDNAKFIAAESVYAVFEAKQDLSAVHIAYAGAKAASVRQLRRTSARIPHAGGRYEPKKPPRIIAGILSLGSEWIHPLGDGLHSALEKLGPQERLDLGCVLRCGGFSVSYPRKSTPRVETSGRETALIFFFLKLLARLQASGTVAALDFNKYGRVL